MTGSRPAVRGVRMLLPLAMLVVAGVVVVLAVRQARALRRDAEAAWRERLRGNADATAASVEEWVAERRSDARLAASEVAELVAAFESAGGSGPTAVAARTRASRHAASMLTLVREGYRYLGAWALDSRGRIVARAESGGAPAAAERDSALATMHDGLERVVGPYRDTSGVLRAAVIAPVRAETPPSPAGAGNAPVGAVILAFDLRERLLSIATPTREASPIGRELAVRTPHGALVMGVRPPDSRMHVALLPVAGAAAPRADVRAALAHDTVGRFTAGLATPEIAATRRVDGLPWAVIRSVSEEYVLGPARSESRADGLALFALGVLGLVGIAAAGRAVRAVKEHAERTTEAQYRLLAEHVSDVIARQDLDGRLLFVSPACREVLGYEPAGLVGRRCDDVIHPEDLAVVHEARAHALAGGEGVTARCRMRRQDGTWLWVETSHRAVRDARGNPTEMVCVLHDDSARQRVEEELRRQALLFATISDAVLILDPATRLVDWNPAAERTFGYQRVEVLGQSPELLHDPSVRPGLGRAFRGALAAGGRWAGEVPFRTKAGAPGLADVVVAPMHDAQGVVTGYVAVLRDITARREMEATLAHREALLREAQQLEAIGRLAGGVAHDFNNELTAITSNVAIALASLPADHAARGDLLEIRAAASRAAALTRQLLAVGRQQVLQPANLDVNAIIESGERMYRGLLGERIMLALQLAPDVGEVRADAGQVREVLLNLVLHARDAMPAGGALSIATARERLAPVATNAHPALAPGEYVAIRLHASTEEMDAETRARLFEPFFTSKALGKGSGLGLSVIYGIVRQSSGDIQVTGARGRGTTFTVYLPSVSPDAPRPGRAADGRRGPARSRATVLLVEDEEAVRTPVRRILAREELTVLEAATGEEALQLSDAQSGPIDLVITDVVMPGINGPELVEQLRERRPGIKVLFMSGYTEQAVAQHGVLAADAAFVAKPFSIDAFVSTVRELLGRGVHAG